MANGTYTDSIGRTAIWPTPEVLDNQVALRQCIEQAVRHFKEAEILTPYSGRMMYGKKCVAVAVLNGVAFAMQVGVYAGITGNLDVMNAALKGVWHDDWGHGMVIYWPDLAPA
jgi:hypothetical protein